MTITSNSPIIFHRNVDGSGNPISISISNESVTVFNNKGYTNQIPDKYWRVAIYDTTEGDMVEIEANEEITTESQYKLPYGSQRIIYFHPNKEGKVLTATYHGIGYIFIPSDNIYTELNSDGTVKETLWDIVNEGKLTWKSPVTNYSDIATTYISPLESWTVQTTSDGKVYRYDGTSWVFIWQLDTAINSVNLGLAINNTSAKTTPVDADMFALMDSADLNLLKKLSWANIKATILSYINTVATTFTNKILTAPKFETGGFIADANGNELIKFPFTVASAVNEITISNASTGNAPSTESTGGDSNIEYDVKTKGNGLFRVYIGGVISFVVDKVASAVNYLKIKSNITGNAPTIEAIGTDTNIDINIVPKGTGVVKLNGSDPLTLISNLDSEKSDKGSPTIYTVTTGFATGWSGTIKYLKNQENLVTVWMDLQKDSDIASGSTTIFTMPAGYQPTYGSSYALCNLFTSGVSSTVAVANIGISSANGALAVTPISGATLTNARRIYGVMMSYYA